MRRIWLALVLVGAVGAIPLVGQAMTGITPWSAYKSFGFDTINLASLDTHSDIPIYSRPGRRMNFSYHLVYDSLIWNNNGYDWVPIAGGWQSTTPIGQMVANTDSGSTCGYLWYFDDSGHYGEWGGDDGSGTIDTTYWSFTDPTGTVHSFSDTFTSVEIGDPPGGNTETDCPAGSTSGFSETTTDGTGITLVVDDSGNGTVYDPDGNQYTPNAVTDRNGNTMYFTVSGNVTTYFDTLSPSSTPALTVTASPNAYAPTTITYAYAGAAGAETVTEKLESTTYYTAFGCSGVRESGGTINDPYEIDLPDGTKYEFTYNLNTGDITSASLPAGGTINYARTFNCSSGWAGASVTLNRTDSVDQGTWQWSEGPWEGGTQTTQTDPFDNISGSYFMGGFPVEAYFGVTQIGFCYNNNTTNCLTTAPSMPITERSTGTSLLDTYEARERNETFDGLSRPTELDETDWFPYGQSFPGWLRKTITSYQSIDGVAEIPTKVETTDGGGNRVAETDYAYDQSTPQATSGVVNHSSPPLGTRGNLTSITRWLNLGGNSPVTTMAYDDTGETLTVTDPNGNGTTYSYTDNYSGEPSGLVTNAFPTTITKPQTRSPNLASHVTQLTYLYATGAIATSTDENGQKTIYTYGDPLSRLTEVDYPDTGSTKIFFNDTSYPQTVETKRLMSGTWQSGTTTDSFVQLDGLGRTVIAATANSEATPWDRADTCFDAAGRLSFSSYPYQASSPTGSPSCSAAGDTRSYDSVNRVVKITHSDGTAISYTYKGRAVETQDEGNGTTDVTRITQPDGLGRLASVCEVSGTTQEGSDGTPAACGQDIAFNGFLTTYSYDLLNDLTQVNQGRLAARSFTFDSLGRMVEDNSPETPEVGYTYDLDGNVVIRTRAKPNQSSLSQQTTTDYYYDTLDRLTEIHFPDGSTPDANFNYDESSSHGLSLANAVGRRSSESTSDGLTGSVFSYDQMGRVVNNSQCTPQNCGSGLFSVTYGYDLAGDQTTITNPDVVTVTTTFNQALRPTALTSSYVDANHPGTFIGSLHYNAAGEELNMAANPGSGLTPFSEARCYSARSGLEDVAVAASATVPACNATSGMIYWLQVGLEANLTPSSANDSANGNWSYTYDEFNRIASAAGPASSFSFVYDRQGNRWQQNLTSGSGPTPSFTFSGGANQMDSYTFDAAGNLISDGNCGYTYDEQSRAVGAGTCASAAWVYDAEGRRVRATVNGSTLDRVYDLQGHAIAEYTPGPNWVRGEIFIGNRPLATYANGTTYFTFADGLGTARARYDLYGNAVESCQSLIFGDALGGANCGSGDPSPLHFTGAYRDYSTGLDHMGARDYASALGRWLTPDPAGPAAVDPNDPQTWDRYAYATNNPTAFIDPSGMLAQPCTTDICTGSDPTGCTVDGMDSLCSTANEAYSLGAPGGGIGPQVVCFECPQLGGMYISPVNGKPYEFDQTADGWEYFNGITGDPIEEPQLWEELDLPDFNLMYNGGLTVQRRLDWNLQSATVSGPRFEPPAMPKFEPPAPPPTQVYSHSYFVFLGCEYLHTLGNEEMTEAWATANGLPILAALAGNEVGAFSTEAAAAGLDIGGAYAISRGCSAAAYGPK